MSDSKTAWEILVERIPPIFSYTLNQDIGSLSTSVNALKPHVKTCYFLKKQDFTLSRAHHGLESQPYPYYTIS